MNGIPVKGADNNTYTTRTETGTDGKETQVVVGQSDGFLRRLFRTLSRLSFDVSGQLRTSVAGSVSISSGTVTTVTTMGTGNMGFSDMGKPATAMIVSRQMAAVGTQANLRRP